MTEHEPPLDFTGLWTFEDPFGGRREIEYVNGRRNGVFREYLPDGTIHREGWLKDGLLHGELTSRNCRGEVIDVSTFENGTGTYLIFTSSGRLGWRIELRGGKRHGRTERFNSRGEITVENYVDGVRVDAKSI